MLRFWNKMPYSNLHELNLNWIIGEVKRLSDEWNQYHADWDEWKNNTDEAYKSLHDYVMNYFENLDVDAEINNKINKMIADGSFTALIAPIVPDIVTEWLNEHITPTTPPVDNTLTVSGAAADAKATGDRIRALEKFNAANILPMSDRTITTNGITFSSNSDGSYNVSGTATARANFNIISSQNSMPDGFKAGEEIYIFYNGFEKVQLQLFASVNGAFSPSSFANVVGDYSENPFAVKIPNDATGILIRFSVPNGTDVTEALTIAPFITNTYSNQLLTEKVKTIEPISDFVAENEDFNSFNVMPSKDEAATHNGITYTPKSDGSYDVEGISTSRSFYNLYFNAYELPENIKPGKPLTVYYNGYDVVQLQFFKAVGGQTASTTFLSISGDYSEGYTTIVPEDIEGVVIRLSVPTSTTIEDVINVKPIMLNAKSNKELSEIVDDLSAYKIDVIYSAFGDSLTLGAVWDDDPATHWYQCDLINQMPTRIANAIGSTNFKNYGVGGSRFVQQQPGDNLIGDMIKSVDLSEHDIITIGGGGNDRSTTLGDGDTATANDGTICGALVDIFEYLNNLYPELQIVMYGVSPMPLPDQTDPQYIYTRKFGGGWNLNDYYAEMRKLCKRYGVGFIDWYDCTLILQWGKLSGGYSENLRNWAHPKNQNIYKQNIR